MNVVKETPLVVTPAAAAAAVAVMGAAAYMRLLNKALAEGDVTSVLVGISSGRIPKGYESFFPGLVPLPVLVDGTLALKTRVAACDVMELPVSRYSLAASAWKGDTEAARSMVLDSLMGSMAKPVFRNGACALVALSPHPGTTRPSPPYVPGVEPIFSHELPGADRVAGPSVQAGLHPRVPAYEVSGGSSKARWVGWVGDGLVIVGATPYLVSRSVLSTWSHGPGALPGDCHYGQVHEGYVSLVAKDDLDPAAGRWEAPRGGYPPGLEYAANKGLLGLGPPGGGGKVVLLGRFRDSIDAFVQSGAPIHGAQPGATGGGDVSVPATPFPPLLLPNWWDGSETGAVFAAGGAGAAPGEEGEGVAGEEKGKIKEEE